MHCSYGIFVLLKVFKKKRTTSFIEKHRLISSGKLLFSSLSLYKTSHTHWQYDSGGVNFQFNQMSHQAKRVASAKAWLCRAVDLMFSEKMPNRAVKRLGSKYVKINQKHLKMSTQTDPV